MIPLDYIKQVADAAVASAAQSHIPASFTIAEGALESGWGSSQLAMQARNLFGVKADRSWHGDILTMQTREYLNGQWVMVPAKWRKYVDWQGCMDDHALFLTTNHRYAAAFDCADVEAFTNEIARAGYATDPEYSQKLLSIIRGHGLKMYDRPA